MASRILLSRYTSRAINRFVFTKQRRCFCDGYPDKSRSWPPESVLAKYRNLKLAKGSLLWLMLNDPKPPPPRPTTPPDSMQKYKPSPPDFSIPGQDLEHYYVHVDFPNPSIKDDRDAAIDYYIKLLAQVIGSEEEAKRRIYTVSTKYYFGFGALLPEEEYRQKLHAMPHVVILGDAYEDVENKRYPGEPFVDGQAVPYDPKYHERELADIKSIRVRLTGRPTFEYNPVNGVVPRHWRKRKALLTKTTTKQV